MKTKLFFFIIILSQFNNLFSQENKPNSDITTKQVNNVSEFINAIADNTKIIIEADTLNLTVSEIKKIIGSKPYKNSFTPAKSVFFSDDGLVLHGFKNLMISGKHKVNLITTNPNHTVITFENCEKISLKKLNIYHHEASNCSGSVLQILHSKNINVEDVDLNGSGAIGLNLIGTDYVWLSYMSIFNNSEYAIQSYNSRHISFYKTSISDNPLHEYIINSTFSELLFQNCTIRDNTNSELLVNEVDYCLAEFNPIFKETSFDNNGFSQKELNCDLFYEENFDIDDNVIKLAKAEIKQEVLINNFFNYLNKNPKPDELLSYFPRQNIKFLDTKTTTQKPVFDYFFNSKSIIQNFEIESIETINYNTANVIFVSFEYTDENLPTYNKVEYNWVIKFDKKYRFKSVLEKEKEKTEIINLNVLGFPKKLFNAYSNQESTGIYALYAFRRAFVREYFEHLKDPDINYLCYSTITNLESIRNTPSFKFEKKGQNKTYIPEVYNYLNNLKLFFREKIYQNIKNQNSIKAIKYKTELETLFNNYWTLNIHQYYADKTLNKTHDLQKNRLSYPVIPNFKNSDVKQNIYDIIQITHGNNLLDKQYKPYSFEYLNRYINGYFTKEYLNTLSISDKRALNKYLKEYREVHKQIDLFMKNYFN